MNIPESAIKAGENLFACDCGYTDTRHKANLAHKSVPESVLREVENGCSIETLESIAAAFPICKYKTQITIHGKFPPLETDRIGRYKNIVRNKNKSVGIRWSAIDYAKRKRLFTLAHICADWGTFENSTSYYLERCAVIHSQEELDATLQKFKAEAERINAAQALFMGGCDILKVPFWGRVYVFLRVAVNSFYERDFDALASVICNMDAETIKSKVAAHEKEEAEKAAARDREIAERRAQWELDRKAEAERKAAFMANLKLPFTAEYGEHKAKQGDIYAVVVHTDRFNSDSPFCVKFYTVKKSFGRLCAYECDSQGNITKQHGRVIMGNKYKGYRKTA